MGMDVVLAGWPECPECVLAAFSARYQSEVFQECLCRECPEFRECSKYRDLMVEPDIEDAARWAGSQLRTAPIVSQNPPPGLVPGIAASVTPSLLVIRHQGKNLWSE